VSHAEENRKELNCTEPAITFLKTPASFTSKHKSAPSFRGKQCVVAKEFGEPVKKVLFVFDGQNPVDVNQLTNQVRRRVPNPRFCYLGTD
jgi:hypothetical protein